MQMPPLPSGKLDEMEKTAEKNSHSFWRMLLIVLTSPLWICLLAAVFLIVLAVYMMIWTFDVICWSFEAFCLCGCLAGIVLIAAFLFQGNFAGAAAAAGSGLFFAGISILAGLACLTLTKSIIEKTKKAASGIYLQAAGRKA